MLERKPKMLVAVALANRMARTAWAFAIALGPMAHDGSLAIALGPMAHDGPLAIALGPMAHDGSLRKGEDHGDPAMAAAWVKIAGGSPRM